MSLITEPLFLDKTGRQIADELHKNNTLLELLAGDKISALPTDIKAVQRLVKSGVAQEVLHIGDQLMIPWSDKSINKEYTMPMDIVSFEEVTLKDGTTTPGMVLQSHYATPYGIPFDEDEALYYAEAELPAGTYNFTLDTSWGKAQPGTYQFTLAQPVPKEGQISGLRLFPDTEIAKWTVSTYKNGATAEAIETVPVTAGTEGATLGVLKKEGTEQLNSSHKVAYGYNRWSQSAIRQWLNSSEQNWWKSQNKFDRIPATNADKPGFMSGFSAEFLSCIQPVKITTALNTVIDDGSLEATYDKFFLPSLEQMYIKPQTSGEGSYWDYWKHASERTTPMEWRPAIYQSLITYALENPTSAQNVSLRSAYRSNGYNAWSVNSSGYAYNGSSYHALRCAPACVIC